MTISDSRIESAARAWCVAAGNNPDELWRDGSGDGPWVIAWKFYAKCVTAVLEADAPAVLDAKIEGMKEALKIARAVSIELNHTEDETYAVGDATDAVDARISALQTEREKKGG